MATAQDAALEVDLLASEARVLLKRLQTDGLDLSLILGGPFNGKEIPVRLRLKPANSKVPK